MHTYIYTNTHTHTYIGLARFVYIQTLYMAVYLVNSLPKKPYRHRIYMDLAEPTHRQVFPSSQEPQLRHEAAEACTHTSMYMYMYTHTCPGSRHVHSQACTYI